MSDELDARPGVRPRRAPIKPTRKVESELLAGPDRVVVGVDEVGRGAWAGPLTVGAAAVGAAELKRLPVGIRDSKALTSKQREALYGPLTETVRAYSLGHASSAECDELGMSLALRLAAHRALSRLRTAFDAVIVDGSFDFTGASARCVVRGDERCVLVASASIIAKVTRDEWMLDAAIDHPDYGFEHNKGYISAEHREAVERFGFSPIHRRSWSVALAEAVVQPASFKL
ncbi:MAG: ribonuclease HII [Acidimicrobiales bacterium]